MSPSPYAVAGLAAGFVSSSILYPLEVVKSRFQMGSHAKFSYSNTMHAISSIYKTKGLKELYRGFPAGLIGSTLSWGLYFYLYEDLKRRNAVDTLSVSNHWTSSMISSIIVQTMLCPLWVVKLNQQLGNCDSFWSGARGIFQKEGVRGLYRGLVPGYWSCSHLALQFVLYEEMKKRLNFLNSEKGDSQQAVVSSIALGTVISTIVSKSLATVVTSPIEVLKVRLRSTAAFAANQPILGIAKEIWRKESWRGFYKGVGTALMRILPNQCLTFVTYELVLRLVR